MIGFLASLILFFILPLLLLILLHLRVPPFLFSPPPPPPSPPPLKILNLQDDRPNYLLEKLKARRASAQNVIYLNPYILPKEDKDAPDDAGIAKQASYTRCVCVCVCVCAVFKCLFLFYRRLLSGVPAVDMISPLSEETNTSDLQEFCKWTQKWGSNARAYKMATTMQMLKDAQRKGEKEVSWQK